MTSLASRSRATRTGRRRRSSETRFALHLAHEGIGPLSSGTLRVNLEVAGLDAATERLRAAGIEVEETMREDWGAAARITDPDGYELYLFQPPAS